MNYIKIHKLISDASKVSILYSHGGYWDNSVEVPTYVAKRIVMNVINDNSSSIIMFWSTESEYWCVFDGERVDLSEVEYTTLLGIAVGH